MIESAKMLLKIYSLIAIGCISLRLMRYVGSKRDLEVSLTIGALVPVFIYVINV